MTVTMAMRLCVGLALVLAAVSAAAADAPDKAGITGIDAREKLDPGATGNRPDLWKGIKVTEIRTLKELDQFYRKAARGPAIVFKHSTTCPVSGAANTRIGEFIAKHGEDVPHFYMVRVIESRPVSMDIAERLGVVHESPQVILVNGGKAVWSTSHEDITGDTISGAVKKYLSGSDKSDSH